MWILFFLALFEGSLWANADVRIIPALQARGLDEKIGGLSRAISDCSFRINGDINDPQPLFSVPNKYYTWQPDSTGVVQIPQGYAIEMHCSDTFTAPFEGRKKLTATCVGGSTFQVDEDFGAMFKFESFGCKSWPTYTARRTGEPCNGGTTLVEVGFAVQDGEFLEMMTVCHDEVAEATRYVHHKLNPASGQYQRSVARPRFIEGDFYQGKNVDRIYTRVEQMKTFGEILGGNHEQYFDSSDIYLARGHMSAKVDHIYGSHQRGTFFFINAAPQWQRFNAGNWERIEDGVRKWTSGQGMYVDCYTGVWGVSTLPDVNGVHQELYLDFDEHHNGLIPVPKLYFRVVIEPATKRGIVLIGVNNPHLTMDEVLSEYVICDDIGDKITWISWRKDDIRMGYSYACEVNEFRKVVTHLPTFDVQGLLY